MWSDQLCDLQDPLVGLRFFSVKGPGKSLATSIDFTVTLLSEKLFFSLLLVAMPFVTSSVLVPSSKATSP